MARSTRRRRFSKNLIYKDEYANDHNYGKFSRENKKRRINFLIDLNITINELYNRPSISTWGPFNEGWGQFDSVKITNMIKKLDKTRFVDHASGWIDQKGPDFKSIHIYTEPIEFQPDEEKRPIVLSEFGGYGLIINGHLGSKRHCSQIMYDSKNKLTEEIKK